MAEIVNLRLARKRAKRRDDENKASAQRARHGISKAERDLGKARRDKSLRDLDQRRLDDGEPE